MRRKIGDATHPHLAVGGQLPGKFEFRRVFRQTRDANRLDDALRKRLAKAAKIGLEPPDHDGLKVLWANLDPAREALGIEHLKQSREAVGVPIVWRGCQEQAVLEPFVRVHEPPS